MHLQDAYLDLTCAVTQMHMHTARNKPKYALMSHRIMHKLIYFLIRQMDKQSVFNRMLGCCRSRPGKATR